MKKQMQKKCTEILKKGKSVAGNEEREFLRKNNNYGITLIALVITVIVLLILAGISISMLSGDNSILNQTGRARDITREKSIAERIQLSYLAGLTGGNGIIDKAGLLKELQNEFGVDKVTEDNIVESEDGKKWKVTIDGATVELDAGSKKIAGDGLEGLSSAERALLPTGITEKTIETISNDNLKDTSKIKAVITDRDGGEVPIPKGANYKEGTESTGLVIEYKGSEFVWVPVTEGNLLYPKGTTKTMAKVSIAEGFAGTDTNGRTNYEGVLYDFGNLLGGYNGPPSFMPYSTSVVMSSYGQGTIDYREPDIVSHLDIDDVNTLKSNTSDNSLTQTFLYEIGLTQSEFKKEMQENYNEMIESVQKYGGFYVGRYETSIGSTTIVASKENTPMRASTDNQMWYGMYDKQKRFTTSADVMQSSMIWGSQYDAMLNWMQAGSQGAKVTATTNGNHSGNPTNTGETLEDIINNVYDLEGNLWEWTLDADLTDCRAFRGGYYNFTYPAAYRGYASPSGTHDFMGSRLSLYIK